MRVAMLGVWVLLSLAGTAAAQPALTPPVRPAAPVQPEEPRSEDVAIALSLGATTVSWAMIGGAAALDRGSVRRALMTGGAIGVLLGPNFGHWYASEVVTRGLGMRVLGVGAATLGVGLALGSDGDNTRGAEVLLALGATLYLVGTIDDIVTAPRAVRRYNQRARELAIVPVIQRDRGGLMVSGQF